MKIGLDFDGVMSDCGALKVMVAQTLYRKNIQSHQFRKEIIVHGGILTADEYFMLQELVYATRTIGLGMIDVPGSKQYVSRLVNDGHELCVVTSRKGPQLGIAEEWSKQQGFNLPFVGVGYGASKAEALREFDVYIDDDLIKLEPLVGIVPHRFLFSWDYNDHDKLGSIAQRVCSWQAFYEILQTL